MGGRRRASRAALLAGLGWLSIGCAAGRIAPPVPPPLSLSPADLSHVELELCSFFVTNRNLDRDNAAAVARLRQSFESHLHSAIRIGAEGDCSDRGYRPQRLVRVMLDASIVPYEADVHRTYFLDALFFYPFLGLFPITPEWGRANVEVTVKVEREGVPLEPIKVAVSAPFSVVFYSWYRTAPREDAYERAYGYAFTEVAQRLARRLRSDVLPRASVGFLDLAETGTVALRARTSTAVVVAQAETSSAATQPEALPEPLPEAVPEPEPLPPSEAVASTLQLYEPKAIRLPEEGVRIMVDPVLRDAESPLGRWLDALGGLEVSATGGRAAVSSSARGELAGEETVGSGQAFSSGWGVALYRPPARTGFFYPLRFGFFSQDIEIRGFRDDVPAFRPSTGTADIPGVKSDPSTGVALDLTEPISYFLQLRSGYLGQGIGFNFLFGTENFQLFATTQAAVNLAEVRHMDVTIAGNRERGFSFTPFGALQVAGQIGVAIPALHLAIRASGELEWMREFSYPEPLEFRGSVAYNPTKDVFERERVFVDGAAVGTANWKLSVVAYY